MEDKVCIITGSNEGIGKETAKRMASHMMRVIMACRNMEKCEAAAKELRAETKNDKIQCMQLDLNSFTSIRQFVQNFKDMNLPLNYLINNAGKYGGPHALTEDGFESQVGVNHFGPFMLTNLLLSKLEASENPRIVVLSSRAHFRAKLDFDNLSVDPKNYWANSVYAQSKLCNLLFTYELQRRLDERGSKIVVNALHPGVVHTNLFQGMTVLNKLVFPLVSFLLTKVTESGEASEALALGTALHLQGVKAKYFNVKFSSCYLLHLVTLMMMTTAVQWYHHCDVPTYRRPSNHLDSTHTCF
ncbi:hypothetical protein SAMD00019534_124560 [Acytostelium subglobosum LB1]|uniref:hypothetical protein n=1 Tax=Acytostelium subglobosum LB1 TaxID=1410327 RepID=UPI00064514DF|nr:hypothetical protein SAMD00019534_124560 [Acytostelium subglobosum LB1]GAM29280.1 hypothetical protein SAMD00019534_124560 [Acytostelium subglobosum LB1]|eukprot:XP_012747778.1 hypothetical protein SAMD00019534_124560 [Acytostelium subglobosum LB1]